MWIIKITNANSQVNYVGDHMQLCFDESYAHRWHYKRETRSTVASWERRASQGTKIEVVRPSKDA